jgi:hypothetical protein
VKLYWKTALLIFLLSFCSIFVYTQVYYDFGPVLAFFNV